MGVVEVVEDLVIEGDEEVVIEAEEVMVMEEKEVVDKVLCHFSSQIHQFKIVNLVKHVQMPLEKEG